MKKWLGIDSPTRPCGRSRGISTLRASNDENDNTRLLFPQPIYQCFVLSSRSQHKRRSRIWGRTFRVDDGDKLKGT